MVVQSQHISHVFDFSTFKGPSEQLASFTKKMVNGIRALNKENLRRPPGPKEKMLELLESIAQTTSQMKSELEMNGCFKSEIAEPLKEDYNNVFNHWLPLSSSFG